MGYSTIDTHCHLDIIREQGQSIEETLEKSRKVGVDRLVQIESPVRTPAQGIGVLVGVAGAKPAQDD